MTDPSQPAIPDTRRHRAWASWLLVPLMVLAIGVCIYMSRHHETQLYGGPEYQAEALIGCAEAEGVSCDIVNTSAWSELLGVPLFTWGIPTYLLVMMLAARSARGRHTDTWLLAGIGLLASIFSIFLFYISKVELGYVCLWCMRLYGINAAILILPLLTGLRRDALPRPADLALPAALFVMFTGVAVTGQQMYRQGLLQAAGGVKLAAGKEVDEDHLSKDQQGSPPALTFEVTTEDKTPGKVMISPDDPWKGNPQAKVAIVEFGDFECGYCKRAGFELRRLYEHYKDDVVFVFKHFPMNPQCNPGVQNMKHPDACGAAMASACAQDQGYFWAMHDLLYKNNHQLKPDNIIAYAKKIGLDEQKFLTCMREGGGKARVMADATEGQALAIHGTPRIWINGQLYRAGQSAEQMAGAIERALGHTGADAAGNIAALKEQASPTATSIPADVPEMRTISHGKLKFQIDTFEAAIVDGKAVSGKHLVPAIRSTWASSKAACEAAGKRLCSEEEWIAACQSAAPVDDDGNHQFADDLIEGTAYPYGDFHEPGRCWENHPNAKAPPGTPPQWRPVYTGEMPACVSPDGVYDLTGNMEEWVGTDASNAVLLGGAFDTPDDKARCYRRNDTYGAGYAQLRTGFRCCRSAP